jgi:hypothetical protein
MSDLNLANCTATQYYDPKVLRIPSSCSAGHALQYSDNHSNYKGPFLNVSYSNVPTSAIIIKPRQSLSEMSNENIPDNFTWRTEGGDMIEDGRRNQGICGCCWAMAFVSALGDRYAIKYKIKAPYPSAMWMVSCGGTQIGKNGPNGSFPANKQCLCGGSIYGAGKWLEEGNSIGKETCWPYSTVSDNPVGTQFIAPNCPDVGDDCCSDCCGNPEAKIKFTIEKGSTKPIIVSNDGTTPNADETIRAIKLDIYQNGPVATTFMVPNDFEDWWSKRANDNIIYTPTNNTYIGGHAVVLTGWGKENDQNYWEVRNSWGKPGFCRFRMSTDIDQEYWTGIDIAISSNGSWVGGPVSVIPGDLSDDGKKEPDNSDSDKKEPDNSDGDKKEPDISDKASSFFKKFNWKIIGIIGIIILVLLIILRFLF